MLEHNPKSVKSKMDSSSDEYMGGILYNSYTGKAYDIEGESPSGFSVVSPSDFIISSRDYTPTITPSLVFTSPMVKPTSAPPSNSLDILEGLQDDFGHDDPKAPAEPSAMLHLVESSLQPSTSESSPPLPTSDSALVPSESAPSSSGSPLVSSESAPVSSPLIPDPSAFAPTPSLPSSIPESAFTTPRKSSAVFDSSVPVIEAALRISTDLQPAPSPEFPRSQQSSPTAPIQCYNTAVVPHHESSSSSSSTTDSDGTPQRTGQVGMSRKRRRVSRVTSRKVSKTRINLGGSDIKSNFYNREKLRRRLRVLLDSYSQLWDLITDLGGSSFINNNPEYTSELTYILFVMNNSYETARHPEQIMPAEFAERIYNY